MHVNAIQHFVNYNFRNIYKYISYTNILVIQIKKCTKPEYSGHLSIVASFGSVPWVTTIDRLDCTARL